LIDPTKSPQPLLSSSASSTRSTQKTLFAVSSAKSEISGRNMNAHANIRRIYLYI